MTFKRLFFSVIKTPEPADLLSLKPFDLPVSHTDFIWHFTSDFGDLWGSFEAVMSFSWTLLFSAFETPEPADLLSLKPVWIRRLDHTDFSGLVYRILVTSEAELRLNNTSRGHFWRILMIVYFSFLTFSKNPSLLSGTFRRSRKETSRDSFFTAEFSDPISQPCDEKTLSPISGPVGVSGRL